MNPTSAQIDSIGFDTVYTEYKLPSIIDFDWKNILKSPPANSSQATFDELKIISRATLNRSKKDIEFVYNMDQDLDTPFTKLLAKHNLSYPEEFIDNAYKLIYPLLLNVKNYWNRPRPTQLADIFNIKIDRILTDTIHTPSYPSGHTVYSSLAANILKNRYPKLATEFDKIVLDTAKARVMQGVHYPSDNQASIVFAKFVYNKLKSKLGDAT